MKGTSHKRHQYPPKYARLSFGTYLSDVVEGVFNFKE